MPFALLLKMPKINVLSRKVFENAGRMPDLMPEMFVALEEYDRTHKLVEWRRKLAQRLQIRSRKQRIFKYTR